MKHSGLRIFTITDILLISALLAISGFLFTLLSPGRPQTVIIYRGNTVLAEYPLFPDRKISIEGRFGNLTIEISRGSARIIESSCKNRICINTPPISSPGAQVVCAPNHIIVEIQSSRNTKSVPDAITR